MSNETARLFLDEAIKILRSNKTLGDKALAQLGDRDFLVSIDDESNSIGVIVKHMAGNMLSRWTDFLTTDGEKSSRDRDMEFVLTPETTRAELLALWEEGWACTFNAIEPLQPEDLEKIVFIRGEPHTVVKAIMRQVSHYAQHTGQIIFLAKHLRSAEWQTLSIPRNRSAEFNARMAAETEGEGQRKQ